MRTHIRAEFNSRGAIETNIETCEDEGCPLTHYSLEKTEAVLGLRVPVKLIPFVADGEGGL